MRTTLLLIISALFTGPIRAQVGVAPEGGFGIANMNFSPSQDPIPYTRDGNPNPVMHYRVGGALDVPMNRHLYFQSGAYLAQRGSSRKYYYTLNDSSYEYISQSLLSTYLDLSVLVLYKTAAQGKPRFFAGMGATPAYIIGGKSTLNDYVLLNSVETNNTYTTKLAGGRVVSLFDIGVTLTAGYESPRGPFFRVYFIGGNKDIGLGTEKDRNNTWGFSAGYFLGKGRDVNKEAADLIEPDVEVHKPAGGVQRKKVKDPNDAGQAH